jgi:hypothetical protein
MDVVGRATQDAKAEYEGITNRKLHAPLTPTLSLRERERSPPEKLKRFDLYGGRKRIHAAVANARHHTQKAPIPSPSGRRPG